MRSDLIQYFPIYGRKCVEQLCTYLSGEDEEVASRPFPLSPSLSHSTLRSPYHMPQNLDRTRGDAKKEEEEEDILQWKHYSALSPPGGDGGGGGAGGAECGLLRLMERGRRRTKGVPSPRLRPEEK